MPSANGSASIVNTAAIRDVASQGRTSVTNFRAIIDQMEQAINASESFWEGDAAELYRNVFRREINEMRQAFEAFAAYPSDLTAQADEYEHVDTDARIIAENAVQAVWADV